jgi:hypothetical protein
MWGLSSNSHGSASYIIARWGSFLLVVAIVVLFRSQRPFHNDNAGVGHGHLN